MNSKDFAIVIGINHYPNYEFSLHSPIDDSKRMYQWLIHPNGGGLDKSNISLITSSIEKGGKVRPSQDEIDKGIEQLMNRAMEAESPMRRFYFYFSGHGIGLSSYDAGICLPFWSENVYVQANVRISAYLELIEKFALFDEIVFVLDCCRTFINYANSQTPYIHLPEKLAPHTSTHVIAFATSHNTPSYESEESDGKHTVYRSYFTKAFLEILDPEKSPAQKPLLSVIRELNKRVPELSVEKDPVQNPDFVLRLNDINKAQSIVFGPSEVTELKNAVLESTTAMAFLELNIAPGAEDVKMILTNASMNVVYEGFESARLHLPEGNYTLETRYFGVASTQEIELNASTKPLIAINPKKVTAILLQGADTSFETYTDPAVYFSKNYTTHEGLFAGKDSSIFLMFRFPAPSDSDALAGVFDFSNQIQLIGPDGLTHDFLDVEIHKTQQGGGVIFSAQCLPGQYYLEYKHKNGAERVPLYCFVGFQTQFFAFIDQDGVLLNSARVLTAPISAGFNPTDEWNWWAEKAFLAMLDRAIDLPPSLQNSLLESAEQNPMCALLACYLLIQRNLSAQEAFDRLEKHLDHHKKDIPDFEILGVMLGRLAGMTLEHAPMITQGTRLLKQLAAKDAVDIKPGSPAQYLLTAPLTTASLLHFKHEKRKPEPAFWVMERIVYAVHLAHKEKTTLDVPTLARRLSLPASEINFTLEHISESNPLFEKALLMQGENVDKEVLLKSLEQLKTNGKMESQSKTLNVTIIFGADALPVKSEKIPIDFVKEFKEQCLQSLEKENVIKSWNVLDILPGTIRQNAIVQNLESTDIFIGLISSGYFADADAQFMHQFALTSGKTFIPVIIRHYLYGEDIEQRDPLPKKGMEVAPVKSGEWEDREEAWAQIGKKLKATFSALR
ncbi:MAG: caspase family protein, partial [Saprospiraceae bacterium]|nr:caspase family protein [Saprospiraceae bacterium]